ncbi:hypothetical protein FQ087_01005 [Sporosarcina sp. ANT_H38]|uniref:hypothetical protein n=1 Tax=Sporosarcina sp. ANT_H38 TaxID=2597358 RepID=UPI0011F22A47|nr:hypothetical protein [Sporosarcina sp. ANT_H38]KAA0964936.1 hypothetical protein FQ087_01005 [Sporosarcina sp. ANT_H38]
MLIILLIFGVVLTVWGLYRMRTDDGLFGKNRKTKNIFNLILMGQASGLGQFLSGVLCMIIWIISFFIK